MQRLKELSHGSPLTRRKIGNDIHNVLRKPIRCTYVHRAVKAYTVVTPTVKSREFYLHDDVTLFSKWPKKNRGVQFLLAASFNEI